MLRHAAAIGVAFILHSTVALAQAQTANVVLRVTAETADVHKGPTTVTPVIGHVKRGAVLPVSRNLGSWVKIAWAAAPDGVGYVHVTAGRLTAPTPSSTISSTKSPSTATATASDAVAPKATATPPPPPVADDGARSNDTASRERVAIHSDQRVQSIGRMVGVGALVGSMSTVGASARTWRRNRLGVQVDFTHDVMTSDVTPARVNALQVAPAVMYALFDRVSDYVWIRPYVGAAVSFRHETLTLPSDLTPASQNGMGFRAFGGTELTFAAVPQLSLSVDLGYRQVQTLSTAFDTSGVGVTMLAHWYVK